MNYTPGRKDNLSKDQRVYTWNGTLRCAHCHQTTVGSKCPHDCPYWIELGFDLDTGLGRCEDCNGEIRLGAPSTSDKGNSIHPQADSFTVFGDNTEDGLKLGITCESCGDLRLDKQIEDGDLRQAADGSYFDPELFPELAKEAEYAANHPAYQAIEASIENGAAFQCGYCGITDDISELDYTHSGVDRCKTCQGKHEAYKPEAAQPKAFDEE